MLQTAAQATIRNPPEMLTIREVARRGVLKERTIRRLVAENKIPVVRSGVVAYINFTKLCEQLNSGDGEIWQSKCESRQEW